MPKKRSIIQTIFNAAIFIALEIAALNLITHKSAVQDFFLSGSVHRFMARVWGGTESVKHYFSLGKENERLAAENFDLTQKLNEYRYKDEQKLMDSLSRQYVEEKQIKAPDTIGNFHYMPATIVKISRNKQHNYLILGEGSDKGVIPHSGIITSNGVVGIVDAVDKHYSYAVSLMNTDLSVSARIGKEGAVGPLTWDGRSSGGALLKEIPLQYKFEPGDTVFTSGFSSIFPADIPIGTAGESRVVNGATYEIKVTLLQDFSRLRYVTLVNNIGTSEIEKLEKQEEGSEEEDKK